MLFPPTPGRHRLPQKIQKPYRFRPKLQLVSLDTENEDSSFQLKFSTSFFEP